MFKRLKQLEETNDKILGLISDLAVKVNALTPAIEETPKESKEDKQERERKEEVDKSWQELFNYTEQIAIKGVK